MRVNFLTTTLFALCSVFALSSCGSEEDSVSTTTGTLYFQADMNGKTLLLPEGKDGYLSKAFVHNEATASGCAEIQHMQVAKSNDIAKSIDISFIERRGSCTTDCAQSKAMLKTGDYNFGSLENKSDVIIEDGVVIRYTDVNGKVWSTDFGAGDQSNSSFKVTKVAANTLDNSSQMLTTAEFECMLYDEAGNEMEITNGMVVSRSIVCE